MIFAEPHVACHAATVRKRPACHVQQRIEPIVDGAEPITEIVAVCLIKALVDLDQWEVIGT